MPSWLHADPEMRGGLKQGRTSTSFPSYSSRSWRTRAGALPSSSDRSRPADSGASTQTRAELCPSNPE
eukprot:4538229-Alexandrium_andersonii.AAC.1